MTQQFELENFNNVKIEIIKNTLTVNKVCKTNKTTLIKAFLKKYQVDYQDPNNFIYFNENTDEFIPATTDLEKVFDLYLAHYYNPILKVIRKNITQIPIFPNLKELYCQGNKLTTLPEMPNLQKLYCYGNKITFIPPMPFLKELSCEYNNLTWIPPMPHLQKLYCEGNKITFIPRMPNLEIIS